MAAKPAVASAILLSFVLFANLLRMHSVLSSSSLMLMINSIGHRLWGTPLANGLQYSPYLIISEMRMLLETVQNVLPNSE